MFHYCCCTTLLLLLPAAAIFEERDPRDLSSPISLLMFTLFMVLFFRVHRIYIHTFSYLKKEANSCSINWWVILSSDLPCSRISVRHHVEWMSSLDRCLVSTRRCCVGENRLELRKRSSCVLDSSCSYSWMSKGSLPTRMTALFNERGRCLQPFFSWAGFRLPQSKSWPYFSSLRVGRSSWFVVERCSLSPKHSDSSWMDPWTWPGLVLSACKNEV